MTKLFILRHGQTTWNASRLLQGSVDISLNDIGIKEVLDFKETFDISKIDIVISSPLKRARETAKIIADNKVDIIYDSLLTERCYGDYEGKEIDHDMMRTIWDYKLNYSDNNVESIKDTLERGKTFLNKITKEYKDKNILIISHGGFIQGLHFVITGYDENTHFQGFIPKNVELYEYEIDN